jgi:hypothetical protein
MHNLIKIYCWYLLRVVAFTKGTYPCPKVINSPFIKVGY